jgi:hypothetical protein
MVQVDRSKNNVGRRTGCGHRAGWRRVGLEERRACGATASVARVGPDSQVAVLPVEVRPHVGADRRDHDADHGDRPSSSCHTSRGRRCRSVRPRAKSGLVRAGRAAIELRAVPRGLVADTAAPETVDVGEAGRTPRPCTRRRPPPSMAARTAHPAKRDVDEPTRCATAPARQAAKLSRKDGAVRPACPAREGEHVVRDCSHEQRDLRRGRPGGMSGAAAARQSRPGAGSRLQPRVSVMSWPADTRCVEQLSPAQHDERSGAVGNSRRTPARSPPDRAPSPGRAARSTSSPASPRRVAHPRDHTIVQL